MNVKKIIDTSNLRGDFFGGLTAGVVALPSLKIRETERSEVMIFSPQ